MTDLEQYVLDNEHRIVSADESAGHHLRVAQKTLKKAQRDVVMLELAKLKTARMREKLRELLMARSLSECPGCSPDDKCGFHETPF